MVNTLPQEEGRYRVLLIRVGDNAEEEKDAFCDRISTKYGVAIPLLRKIVDSSPIVLKKNLSLQNAKILADIITSFGATVSIEKRWDVLSISVEFQEMTPPCVALEACTLRKTAWGTWNVLGRMSNITGESLRDVWVLVQLFGDLDEFLMFEEVPVLINPLPPGEAAPFKAVFEGELQVKRISLAFKGASGMPLPAEDHLKKQEWVSVETGLPLGREDLQDSDLDVPVLEIHGKPETKGILEKKTESGYPSSATEELYLEIESDASQGDSLPVLGEEEDVREEEMARLAGEFLSLSSSTSELGRGMDLFLPQEGLPSHDEGVSPLEPTEGFVAEEIPGGEALDGKRVESEIPEAISLPAFAEEEAAAEKMTLGAKEGEPPEPLEQPAEAQFEAPETAPSLPAEEAHGEVKEAVSMGAEIPEAPETPVAEGAVVSSEIPEAPETPVARGTVLSAEIPEAAVEEKEAPPFPWIEKFRMAVEAYYQGSQDNFSIWFEKRSREGALEDPLHRILTILTHARFMQMCPPEKALENTEKVYALILKPDLILDEIPPLEGTQFSPGEKWRNLFYRAIPKLREIAGQVTTRGIWTALELERLIQVIPHMSGKASDRAVRWIHALMDDVVRVDFDKTFPSVGENLYRVACRLGVMDPHFDHFHGRNSLGDLKIQSFARMAFPSHPRKIEEPMDWVGMEGEKGGHCFPTWPKCDGCLFGDFCQKLYLNFNPSEKGMVLH